MIARKGLAIDKFLDKTLCMDSKQIYVRLNAIIGDLMRLRMEVNGEEFGLPETAKKLMEERICLYCLESLGDSRPIRGCHESCKKRVLADIEDGKFSEFEAITTGKIAPAQPGGGASRKSVADDEDARQRKIKEKLDALMAMGSESRVPVGRQAKAKPIAPSKTARKAQ